MRKTTNILLFSKCQSLKGNTIKDVRICENWSENQ